MRNPLGLLTLAGLIALAPPAFGSTAAKNTDMVSPTLTVSVTVQKMIHLTLATGTRCPVRPATDYTVSFGNADTPAIHDACSDTFAPRTPRLTNAVYHPGHQAPPAFISPLVSTSGMATTSDIGVSVSPTSATALTGTDAVTITYTLTVQ